MTDSANSTIVVIGAGQAGGETATQVRKLGHAGRIVLIGEEPHIPYKRPPLSKAYLAGSIGEEGLYVVPRATLDKAGVEFLGNTRVTRIDRAAKSLELADGSQLAYDKLALTTGGRARNLPMPGAESENVFTVRSIADVQKIRPLCQPGARAVIIGGGFIGLEAAAVAVKLGVNVTVLEGLPRVLARVTCAEVSAFFTRVHREAGVDLRTGVQIQALETSAGKVTAVLLADGSRIAADLVIVGIGQLPNVELAEAAGLAIDNGIVVDECARTSDPNIVAAGDCANHPSAFYGRRLRLESVQNALEQSRAAAATLVGQPQPYHMVPWFWSDQYELKLQMVGLSAGYDQLVIRGDLGSRNFAAFYLLAGRMIAADTVSRPQDFMVAKKLVALGTVLDAGVLADEAMPLKALLPAA